MKYLVLLLAFAGAATAQSQFYISPSGSDGNAGTSQAAPWKTFAHAIPLLNPGATLNLLNGTYNVANGTGFPSINCSTTAHNGTAAAPITIQALNERQAWIRGDGSAEPFQMSACSYWNIIGLYVSDVDNNPSHENDGTFAIYNSSHLDIRRNIIYHANRCANDNLVFISGTTNSVIEENEMYFFHRWGLQLWQGSNSNEVRRNYANPRGAFQASNPTCATYGSGPAGMGSYYSNSNIFENNISETLAANTGDLTGFDNEATSSNSNYLGNVSLNQLYVLAAHLQDAVQPSGNAWTNSVVITPQTAGFWMRGGTSTLFNHDSIFGNGGAVIGFGLNPGAGSNMPTNYTGGFGMTVNNSQVQNLTSATDGAYFIASNIITGFGGSTFSYDHDNNFNNSTTYNPNSHVTNALALNPAYGTCYLWAPDGTALKGAASDGLDVGATVLYQYVGGALTGVKLWNTSTGAPLFAGATVAGLNDVAGSSLFDIANRLNINQNGCSFPAAYAGGLNPPTNVQAVVQ